MKPLLVKLALVMVLLVVVKLMHVPTWLGVTIMFLGGYIVSRAVDQTQGDDWE